MKKILTFILMLFIRLGYSRYDSWRSCNDYNDGSDDGDSILKKLALSV